MQIAELPYFGVAILVIILIVFEFQYHNSSNPLLYTYYAPDGSPVYISHVFGSLYKVYISGTVPNSPMLQLKQDRHGSYFSLSARSAPELEAKIDELWEVMP